MIFKSKKLKKITKLLTFLMGIRYCLFWCYQKFAVKMHCPLNKGLKQRIGLILKMYYPLNKGFIKIKKNQIKNELLYFRIVKHNK